MANCCSTERKPDELSSNISPNPATPMEPQENNVNIMIQRPPSIMVNQARVVQQTPVPEYEDELFLKYIDFKRKWLNRQNSGNDEL